MWRGCVWEGTAHCRGGGCWTRTHAVCRILFVLTGASSTPRVLLAGEVDHILVHHSLTGLAGGTDHCIVPGQLLVGAYTAASGLDDGPRL